MTKSPRGERRSGSWIRRFGANWLGHGDLLSGATSPGHWPGHRRRNPELEVRAMHDDSVLVAVEAALDRPAFCGCGSQMVLDTHDGSIWLECAAFERPSRLPNGLAQFMRELGHDRRLVIELPEVEAEALAA